MGPMDKAQEWYDAKLLWYNSFYEHQLVVERLKGRLTTFFRECREAWAKQPRWRSRATVLPQKPRDPGVRRGQRKLPRSHSLLQSMTERAFIALPRRIPAIPNCG